MKKLVLACVVTLGAWGVWAETKTWVGGTSTDWKEGANWSPEGVPATTDEVVIDGDVTVNWNSGDWSPNNTVTVSGGAKLIQTHNGWQNFGADAHLILDNGTYDAGLSTTFRLNAGKITIRNGGTLTYTGALTRSAGSVITVEDGTLPTDVTGTYTLYAADTYKCGDFTISGEFQPQDGAVLAGANWTCGLFAPQTANSTITALAGNLVFQRSDFDGFYQGGTTHIDFPANSTASLTIQATPETIYAKTFGTTKYTYAGAAIDAAQFGALFEVTALEGGYTKLALATVSDNAAEFGDFSIVVGETDDTLSVQAAFVQAGNPSARVYLVWGAADGGRHLSGWGENVAELGSASVEAPLANTVANLPTRQMLVCRLIAVSDEAEAATEPLSVYMRQYGVTGTVNEFLGTAGTSLSVAANWSLGHVPAESEIRWFETADVEVAGTYLTRATDVYRGGEFQIGGELKPADGTLFAGTDFTFTILSTPATEKFTLAGGHFTATSANHGGYYNGAGYGTLTSGSRAVLTFPVARTALAATAAKFRYNGVAISNLDEASVWTVEEGGDEAAPTTTFFLTPSSADAPVLGAVSATVSAAEATSVTVSACLDQVGGAQPTAFTLAYGLAMDALTETVEIEHGTLADGDTVTKTLTGLTARRKYYYQVTVENAAGSTSSDIGSFVTYNVPAGHAAWVGGVSARASEARNWSTGVVPNGETDVEILDVMAQAATLEWDVAGTVKSWSQESFAGGIVTVVFETTLDAPLTITGDVYLGTGANWTHKGPGAAGETPTYALNVVVGGDFTVGAGACVQAGRGYANDVRYRARGYYNAGPGFVNVLTNETEFGVNALTNRIWFGRGASFAGDGGYRTGTFPEGLDFVSYGSVLNPLSYGSSGLGDGSGFAGAGIVKLTVGGTLTVDGDVEAIGFGYPNLAVGVSAGASSGGSINIAASALAGSGAISADGGVDQEGGNGAGGRIRVRLTDAEATFAAFSGEIHAYGGSRRNGVVVPEIAGVQDAAAGTVVTQLAADPANGGTVTIANLTGRLNAAGATHLPAMEGGERKLSKATVVVTSGTKVKLTRDLSVGALTVAGAPVASGTYTAAALNAATGTDLFSGSGVLSVGSRGFILTFK